MRGRRYAHRGAYGKKNMWIVGVLSAVGTLLAVTLILVSVGIALSGKVKHTKEGETLPSGETSGLSQELFGSPVQIQAPSIALGEPSAITEQCANAITAGHEAVTVNVTDREGYVLIRPSAKDSFGYVSGKAWDISPKSLVSRIKARSLYVSVCLSLRSPSESDPAARLMKQAYETAVIAELLEAGADEVVLLNDSMDEGRAEGLTELCKDVRRIREGKLGVALPASYLADETAAATVEQLLRGFDFGCVLTASDVGDDAYSYVVEHVRSTLYYVLRYHMRVALPYVSDEALADMQKALADEHIVNYQIVTYQ